MTTPISSPPFARTTCACESCVSCCKRQPGPLAAGDFERIAEHLGISREEAKNYFWASPGALVMHRITGKVERVGSITPKFARGRCVFLDQNDRCRIHPVAPAGCAYFDTHMGSAEAQRRGAWIISGQQSSEYKALRDELPPARSYKPNAY